MPSHLARVVLGLLFPALLIAGWEIGGRLELINTTLVPVPSTILATITALAADGSLWGHIGITLYRILWGFFWGTAVALVIGSFVAMSKVIEALLDPTIQAIRAIPSLAWVPLFILWLGIGEPSKVTLIALGVFFPVYLNTVGGIQSVDRKLIEVGKAYGLNTFQLVRRIILPASLPSFLIGLRSGLGLGWMFVVAAELLGASQGLGYLLVIGQNTFRPDTILASIVLFAILGKLTDFLLKKLQERALHWQDNLNGQQ
ncbi:ABC transporter permease [Paenalkalicoccus suaedae]|uniref:ABC transporter permease n=2 Tax=Paenalkalicoccus suaedae TaxID=2592382 RepID=A0A859FKI8_9BACI|nr:ABC transporter permease [Paenalkalicoccus suaedae]QKS73303.1 ABC transporter permease [Paenalkalicoccus suaedae]